MLPEPWAELWMAPPRVSRPKDVWGKRGELKLLIPIPDILKKKPETERKVFFQIAMHSEVAKKQNERNFRTKKEMNIDEANLIHNGGGHVISWFHHSSPLQLLKEKWP